MRQPIRLIGLASGVGLYGVILSMIVLMEGWPSARQFIRAACTQYSIVLLVGEAILYATVMFALTFVWAYVTIRPLSSGKRLATQWLLVGMIVAWLSWIVYGLATGGVESLFPALPQGLAQPSCYLLPMWTHIGILVAPFGILLAGAQARRNNPSVRLRVKPASSPVAEPVVSK